MRIYGESCDGYADLAKRYYDGLDERLKAPFTLGLGHEKRCDNKKYPQKEMAREYFYYFKDKKARLPYLLQILSLRNTCRFIF